MAMPKVSTAEGTTRFRSLGELRSLAKRNQVAKVIRYPVAVHRNHLELVRCIRHQLPLEHQRIRNQDPCKELMHKAKVCCQQVKNMSW